MPSVPDLPVAPPAAPRPDGVLARFRAQLAAARGGDRLLVARDVVFGPRVRVRVADGGSVQLGPGVAVGERCQLDVGPGAELVLGAGVRLGDRCRLRVTRSVVLAAGSVLGDDVFVCDEVAGVADVERPLRDQDPARAAITIGERVRVGSRAAIGPGARIAPGGRVPSYRSVR